MSEPRRVYDVLGVGFGPANLAIATAFADNNLKAQRDDAARLRKRMSVGFVEAHPEFRWHPGMMVRFLPSIAGTELTPTLADRR